MAITRDQLVTHVADLAAATRLPLHVDTERCFPDDPDGVAETVRLLADAGAAGCSIEDWNPGEDRIDALAVSVDRVVAVEILDATIERLVAYRDAGAEVVYAPGLVDPAQISRVVTETGVAVNVLLLPGGPTVPELAVLGVRRVSLGSHLSNAAYGAVVDQATAVRDTGTLDPTLPRLTGRISTDAFEG